MKLTIESAGRALLIGCLLTTGCGRQTVSSSSGWQSIRNPAVTAQLKSFVAQKEAQANASTNPAAPGFASFFAAARAGDWLAVSNAFVGFRNHAGQYEHAGATDERLRGTKWQALIEIWGTFDAFGEGEERYSAGYANGIIESIPPGSIYFGGTDPGRFLITGMQKSQVKAEPFFTITQNALADSTYLDYLRSMYGGRIYIPTAEAVGKAFQEYSEDAERRRQSQQLKPGEDVQMGPDGKMQIHGQVAVMEINGLIARNIFEQNSNHEFYVEESFPLEWMYPYLEPHGLIFKLNRQPLAGLSDEIVRQDHDYWTKCMTPMIGSWLGPDTTLQEIAAFAEKVFARHDFAGFAGDPRFVQNAYSHKTFSKERSSIAGLYAWRAQLATDPAEKRRMRDAADFAFRQSFALCPYSPEAVYRYVGLLVSEERLPEAILLAETASKMPEMSGSDGKQIRDLISHLQETQRAAQRNQTTKGVSK